MSNLAESKAGTYHISGSSPSLRRGGGEAVGSSHLAVPGAKARGSSCMSALPALTPLKVLQAVLGPEPPEGRQRSEGPQIPVAFLGLSLPGRVRVWSFG